MSFRFTSTTLRFSNLKTRRVMNAKISVFVICVEAITYLLLRNPNAFTFKKNAERVSKDLKSSKHHNIRFQMKEHLNIQCSLFKYFPLFSIFMFHFSYQILQNQKRKLFIHFFLFCWMWYLISHVNALESFFHYDDFF